MFILFNINIGNVLLELPFKIIPFITKREKREKREKYLIEAANKCAASIFGKIKDKNIFDLEYEHLYLVKANEQIKHYEREFFEEQIEKRVLSIYDKYKNSHNCWENDIAEIALFNFEMWKNSNLEKFKKLPINKEIKRPSRRTGWMNMNNPTHYSLDFFNFN